MITNRDDLIQHIAKGNQVKYLHFWGHTQKSAAIDKSCLSQWFPASFVVENTEYKTAEHYMMAQKARLFGDVKVLDEILTCTSPAEAKKLGRKVKSFDGSIWNQHNVNYVVEGNTHKFRQNESLKRFLLNTKERIFVEASPRDRIWGIGMGINNPHASNPVKWRGKNLLGFALLNVRQVLRQEEICC